MKVQQSCSDLNTIFTRMIIFFYLFFFFRRPNGMFEETSSVPCFDILYKKKKIITKQKYYCGIRKIERIVDGLNIKYIFCFLVN